MNIATVVEGPTDRLVLEAIVNHLYPGEHRYFPLQPSGSATFGTTGTGWKGVRRWCQETWQREGASLEKIISLDTGDPLDLLIIHVDADIAIEEDLQEGLSNPIQNVQPPCPPIMATVRNLQQIIAGWLNFERIGDLPPQLILVTPAQDIENWTFAALFPDDPRCRQADYECTQTGNKWPGYLLTLRDYRRIFRRTNGTVRKTKRAYEAVLPTIVTAWPIICEICSQADYFNDELMAKAQP